MHDGFMKRLLKGRIFVLTGTLENLTRQEAKDRIQEAGGIVQASLNIQTDFLVTGENPGSKAKKANSLDVKIIDEAEFLKLLDNKIVIPEAKGLKPEFELFGPKEKMEGGGLFDDAIGSFEKPTTFYVIKFQVPINDGSISVIHKAGVCVGKVVGGRYSKEAPIEVLVEIQNLHRSVARTIEGKMLMLMKKVPWKLNLDGEWVAVYAQHPKGTPND